jgi:hypothetical protein
MNDNGEIKIDHNIPVPSSRAWGTNPLTKALAQMAVGDSIVIPKVDRNRAISAANYRGRRVAMRTIGEGLIRVWRVK